MKRLYAVVLMVVVFAITAFAQKSVDTLSQVVERETVWEVLDGSVSVSDSLAKSMDRYISENPKRAAMVYRLRIFFDNRQDARTVSEQVMQQFSELYPDVPTFRGYSNPYFKVTVGNFRSKSEAMKFMEEIRKLYPSVFLVRETFSTI
jgi:hypothetical protein